MEDLLRLLGLLLFGMSLTWLATVALGRLISRRGVAVWARNRTGLVGRVLLIVGFGLALFGLSQGSTATGSSLVLLGSLLVLAGLWLVMIA